MIKKIKELREISGAGMMDVKKALEATNGDIEKALKWLRENGISKAAKKADRIAAEGSIFISSSSNGKSIIELNSETDYVSSNELFLKFGQEVADFALDKNISDVEDLLKLEINGESIESHIINLTATIGEKISLRRISILDGLVGSYKHSNNKIGVLVKAECIDEEILKDISMQITAMDPKFLSKDEIPQDVIDYETNLAKKDLEKAIEGKPEKIVEGMIKGKVNKILSESVLLEQPFVKDSSKKVKDLQGSGKIISFIRYEVGEGIEKNTENFAEEVAKQINK